MIRCYKTILSVLISFMIMVSSIPLLAESGDLAAGFILGDPTGLTGKYFVGSSDAVDFGLGATYHDGFYIYGDYLRHLPGIFPVSELVLYVGGGAGFHHHDRDDDRNHHRDEYNSLECRVPVGIEYTPDRTPLGIFLEIVPALQVVPDIDSDIRGGLGLRYYF